MAERFLVGERGASGYGGGKRDADRQMSFM